MHDSSSAYRGESSPRRGKRRFDDDEPTTAKRVRRRRALPPIEVFDATGVRPEPADLPALLRREALLSP